MNLRRGQLVAIEFLDHCANASTPIHFVLYGRLTSIQRASLTVDSWCHVKPKHPHDNNCVRHTLVRSAITKITQLKEVRDEA